MSRHHPDMNETLIAHTEDGSVRGQVDGGVRTWLGIPFAAAPVGERRFRAPQRVEPWEDVMAADGYGSIPVQKRGFEAIGGAGAATPMAEDCLTINVSAPLLPGNKPRPVVVWIYGGGFSLGGSRGELYRGNRLVEAGDVIYVSFNYRVGAFGFLHLSAWSTPEQPIDGNLGLRDQVAALQWVRRNIAAFGGDPDNVTLFGQSAGAMSVLTLMCIPAAAGLFQRAFAMSAPGLSAFSQQWHDRWGREFLSQLGLDPDDKPRVRRALAELSAEGIAEAASRFFYAIAPDKYPGMLPTSPAIDGDFLPRHPLDIFRDGAAHRVPLVIGTMAREGAMLAKALPVIPCTSGQLDDMFHDTDVSARERVASAYAGYPSRKAAVTLGGDFTFWLPSVLIADAHSRYAPTWSYRFDYATPLTRLLFGEATHGLDLPMVFGTTGEGHLGMLDLLRKRRSKKVSQRFQATFLAFTHGQNPDWSAYDEAARRTRIFDNVDREEQDPRRERRQAWDDYRGPA